MECRNREKNDGGSYKICYTPDENKKKKKKNKLVRKKDADATRAKASDFLGEIEQSSITNRARQEFTRNAPRFGINGAYKTDNLKTAIGITREEANQADFFNLMNLLPADIKKNIGGQVLSDIKTSEISIGQQVYPDRTTFYRTGAKLFVVEDDEEEDYLVLSTKSNEIKLSVSKEDIQRDKFGRPTFTYETLKEAGDIGGYGEFYTAPSPLTYGYLSTTTKAEKNAFGENFGRYKELGNDNKMTGGIIMEALDNFYENLDDDDLEEHLSSKPTPAYTAEEHFYNDYYNSVEAVKELITDNNFNDDDYETFLEKLNDYSNAGDDASSLYGRTGTGTYLPDDLGDIFDNYYKQNKGSDSPDDNLDRGRDMPSGLFEKLQFIGGEESDYDSD